MVDMKKEFTLMEILSGITGYLLVERFERVHELIEWIMGGAVFTHQIPDIAGEVKKRLCLQFPQLANLQSICDDLSMAIKCKNTVIVDLIETELKQKFGYNLEVTKGK